MTKAEARLEALKLAVRPGLDGPAILAAANVYFDFITKDTPEDEEPKPAKKATK